MNQKMEKAVVMACDINYAPYAMFLATQIASYHPHRDFDICLFTQDIIDVPVTLDYVGVKVINIPSKNPFENGPNPSRHGAAAYLKLLIPPLVQNQYKRILYLDSDIFLCSEGLNRLFDIDLLGSPIAAVRDNQQWRTPNRLVSEFKALGLPASPYFNSGMLLIDVQKYVAEDILDQCLKKLSLPETALLRHDQSLLNHVMRNRWTEVSPVWNWQYTWSSRFFVDLAEPYLIHFIGAKKPWKDSVNGLPARYRRAYSSFIRAHYRNHLDASLLDPQALGWPKGMVKILLKHLISIAPMKRYLDRFSHDTTFHKLPK